MVARLFKLAILSGFALPMFVFAEEASIVAQLRIPRLSMDVPVYTGTSQRILALGSGHVVGTASPGQPGNAAISAHRDTFFKPLQHVNKGDLIELDTVTGNDLYQVTEVFVTDALDVSVLDESDTQMITLITCYPFAYQGFAPDRFIVRAKVIDE